MAYWRGGGGSEKRWRVPVAIFSSDLASAGLGVRIGAGGPPVGPRGRLAEVGIQRRPGDTQVLPRRIVRVLTRRSGAGSAARSTSRQRGYCGEKRFGGFGRGADVASK